MKKLCFVLAVLLLLTGCVSDPTPAVTLQPTATTAPEETVVPTQTTSPPETTENYPILETTPDGEIVIPDFDIPEYEGELLVPYDPDREVCILFKETFDYYASSYFSGTSGYILTTKPYAVEDIQLITDMRNELEVTVTDLTKYIWDKESYPDVGKFSGDRMNAIHYISMQGGDWYEIAKATKAHVWLATAGDEYRKLTGGTMPAVLAQKIRDLSEQFGQLAWGYGYSDAFEQYTLSETPGFYCYQIEVRFNRNSYVEETVNDVSVRIGNKTYPVDVTWHFHTDSDPNYRNIHDWKYLTELNSRQIVRPIQWNPFNGGYLLAEEAMYFQAQKDITITGLRCEDIDAKVLGCRVYIESDKGNMDFHWDMQQPLDISQGARVKIDPIFYSQEFEDFSFNYSMRMTLDYEVNNKAYSAVQQFKVGTSFPAFWDVYLTVFEGVDIGGYYVCFNSVISEGADWMHYIPESWKQ